MARVKSEAVREAILSAATAEFSENGYLGTTIHTIAKSAGTAPSNVYVYFASKLEIMLAVYEPWFKKRILKLEKAVARKKTPEQKLLCLIEGLLRDIAADDTGYTSTLIAALATASPPEGYRPYLLLWAEDRIGAMIGELSARDPADPRLPSIARLLMLVFDGVAVRSNLKQNVGTTTVMLEFVAELVLSEFGTGAIRNG